MKSVLKTFVIVCVCLLCLGILGSIFGKLDGSDPLPDDTTVTEDSLQKPSDSLGESEEPVMISFTLGGKTCTCPEGYTWQQFFDSDYSAEIRSDGDYGIYDGYFGYQGSHTCSAETIITDGYSN